MQAILFDWECCEPAALIADIPHTPAASWAQKLRAPLNACPFRVPEPDDEANAALQMHLRRGPRLDVFSPSQPDDYEWRPCYQRDYGQQQCPFLSGAVNQWVIMRCHWVSPLACPRINTTTSSLRVL